MGCLYEINFPDGKKYIGITARKAEERFKQHRSDSKRGSNTAVLRAIREFGVSLSDFKVLVISDDCAYLRELERRAIALYDTQVPNGYNSTAGGEVIGRRPKTLRGKLRVASANRTLQEFEDHTGLGPTSAARLLGMAYSTYAQLRSGTRKLQTYTARHIEVLQVLPVEVLDMLIKEHVHGTSN